MPVQRSHGRDYVEPERHDELSSGVPGKTQPDASQERRAGGQGIQPGATVVPAMGGRARKGRTKLTHDIALAHVDDKLKRQARFMRKRTCSELARTVGGGTCGIIASALVKLASEDMALREAAFASGEIDMARRLGESARGHLLYAREVCSKDAVARGKAPDAVRPGWRLVEGDPVR